MYTMVSIENTHQTQIISSSCISAPNTFNKSAAVPKSPTDTHFKYYVDIAYETFLNISCMICVNKSVSDIGRFETFYKTRMNAQKISHKRTALGSVANLRHFRSTNQFCESTINNQNVTFMKRITKDATKKEVKLATLITAAADSSQTSY